MLRLPHAGKQLMFLLLSLADLTMTWALIRAGLGQIYESNPVAAWCLRWQGWAGLALFKAVMVLISIALVAVISWRRPRTGGRVLALSCLVTAAVVLYSGYLYLTLGSSRPMSDLQHAHVLHEQLETRRIRLTEFLRLQDGLVEDLAADRRSLAEALAKCEPAAKSLAPMILNGLRSSNPARSDRECLAIHLMRHCVTEYGGNPQAAQALAERLDGEFFSLFGTPPSPQNQAPKVLARTLATASRDS
jgi:hypothetical protein